jgi:hypothetical protein
MRPVLVEMDRPTPRGTADTGLGVRAKWLIGVPFRADNSRVVRLYYVVDGTRDVAQAVQAAMERANSAQERRARGGTPVTAEDIEVRRIMLDALGYLSLEADGDGSAVPKQRLRSGAARRPLSRAPRDPHRRSAEIHCRVTCAA